MFLLLFKPPLAALSFRSILMTGLAAFGEVKHLSQIVTVFRCLFFLVLFLRSFVSSLTLSSDRPRRKGVKTFLSNHFHVSQSFLLSLSAFSFHKAPPQIGETCPISLFVFPLPHKSPAALRRGKAFISNRFRASLSFLFGRFSSFIRFFLTLFSDRSRRFAAGTVLSFSVFSFPLFPKSPAALRRGFPISLKTVFSFQATSFPLQISLFPYFIPFYPFFIPFSPSSRFLSNNFLKKFVKTYCFFCKFMV